MPKARDIIVKGEVKVDSLFTQLVTSKYTLIIVVAVAALAVFVFVL